MTYEDFYNKIANIVKTYENENVIAFRVIATLEDFRLDQEAAQLKQTQCTCRKNEHGEITKYHEGCPIHDTAPTPKGGS